MAGSGVWQRPGFNQCDRDLNRPLANFPSTSQPPITDGSLDGGILITIHRLSHGGADRVAMHLANGFARDGTPVGIAVLRNDGEGEQSLLDLLDPGIRVGHAGAPMGSRHLELVRGARYLRRLTATARPAIVLASSNNMGLVTGLALRGQKVGGRPKIVMKTTNPVIRPEDRSDLRKLYRRRLYGFVFGNFDRVLTLSAEECDLLAQLYPRQREKFQVATNPYVKPEMLHDYERPQRSGPATILTLARMMPQKRLDLLLAAFARVQPADCKLVIVGDGPERPRLEALAHSLGIADRVNMPGFVDDALPWLRTADLFALSSDYEGLPAAVLEALACNVPVVTTESFDAARSMIADAPRCAVVPLGDINGFAKAIERSLASRAEGDLRHIASGYGFDAAFASHLDALRPLMRSN